MPGSIAVICEPEDSDALWLAAGLRAHGVDCRLILPEELLLGSRLSLQIAADETQVSLVLDDGYDLGGATAIINRMVAYPVPALDGASDADLVYAAEEVRAALAAAFLALPCRIMGRPSPYRAAGPVAAEHVLRRRAAMLGLAAGDAGAVAGRGVLVFGDRVFGEGGHAVPAPIARASCSLSHAESAALALRLAWKAEGPCDCARPCGCDAPLFLGVDPLPRLASYGPGVPAAVAAWAAA